MDSLKNHRQFLLGLVMLWALFFLGHSWEDGLKMDAMIESAIAKHLLSQSDWSVLHFAPQSYPHGFYDHPPFLAWVEALFFKVFGASDSVARIPPALFALGTLIGVFAWGVLTGNVRRGLLAVFILLTSNRYIKFASDVLLEGPLCFFLIWSAVFFQLALKKEGQFAWRDSLLMGFCLGGAFLTKSIFAVLLPTAIGLSLLIKREQWAKSSKVALISLAGFLSIVGLWVLLGKGWPFIQAHFQMLSGRAQKREWTNVFIPFKNICSTYWPWLPLFVWGVVRNVKLFKKSSIGDWLAISLSLVVFCVFSLGNQIWEHYLILFLPSAAVVTSQTLDSILNKRFESFEKCVLGLSILVSLLLAICPIKIRRERNEPLKTTLMEVEAICSGQKEIVITQKAMPEWMAIAIVSWKTSYAGISTSSPDVISKPGQLLITELSETPPQDWVRVPLARSKLSVFQPRSQTYCQNF